MIFTVLYAGITADDLPLLSLSFLFLLFDAIRNSYIRLLLFFLFRLFLTLNNGH